MNYAEIKSITSIQEWIENFNNQINLEDKIFMIELEMIKKISDVQWVDLIELYGDILQPYMHHITIDALEKKIHHIEEELHEEIIADMLGSSFADLCEPWVYRYISSGIYSFDHLTVDISEIVDKMRLIIPNYVYPENPYLVNYEDNVI